ncbi:MAG: carotenoid biosynthesis protein [Bacteroidales bacterium]|jgi:putative membrane protein|nr:carotenoid biosynthesis protein [Bacteroidales bacterium]
MKNSMLNQGNPDTQSQNGKWLLGLSLFFLAVFLYMIVHTFLGRVLQLPAIPGGSYGKLIAPVLFAFCYFVYTRGYKSAIFLILFSVIYCWIAEETSVHTGFPYGHYYYSDEMGYKLDVVPILIGLNYFWVYIFPVFYLSNLIAQGTFLDSGSRLKTLLFTSFIASILIAGIDMAVDPLDSTKMSEWVWTKNAFVGYYGIPYSNYLGYLVVMTPAFFIYGLMERRFQARPMGPVTPCIAAIPLVFYFLEFILYSVPAPSGVFLVACFTMLFPLFLGIDKLIKFFRQ